MGEEYRGKVYALLVSTRGASQRRHGFVSICIGICIDISMGLYIGTSQAYINICFETYIVMVVN